MTRFLTLFFFLGLGACAEYHEKPTTLGTELQEGVYDFKRDAPTDHLTPEEQLDLRTWLSELPLAGVSLVTLESADYDMLQSGKVAETMAVLRETGIPAHRLRLAVLEDAGLLSLRLDTRVWKLAKDCPHWGGTGRFNEKDGLAEHLGCATAGNFALQVADPDDLVRGQSQPGAEGETAVRAIENYHGAATAATTATSSGAAVAPATTGQP